MSRIGDVAKGNWRYLLITLGVDAKFLINKHGPCPICGGDDRFRWDNQNDSGGYICSQCGGGDGFDLVIKVTGRSFREVADEIAKLMDVSNTYQRKEPDEEARKQRDAMRRGWERSWQPKDGSPVGMYLNDRVGCLWASNAIREGMSIRHNPVMVCKVVDHTGERAVNLHLTFLTEDGKKADITPAKKVMPGKLPPGCAIRLGPVAPMMGVAEGIETAISASIMHGIPVWACVNGILLSQWIPPQGVEKVVVFGDNDANYTGQSKAYQLANRLEVQYKRRVTVKIPPVVGEDWNDFHHYHHIIRNPSAALLLAME